MCITLISFFPCAAAWIGDFNPEMTVNFLRAIDEVAAAITANVPIPGLEDLAGVNGRMFTRFWQGMLQCSTPGNGPYVDVVLSQAGRTLQSHLEGAGVLCAGGAAAVVFVPWVFPLVGAAKAEWVRQAGRLLGDLRALVRGRAPDGVDLDAIAGGAPGGQGLGDDAPAGGAPAGPAAPRVPDAAEFDFFQPAGGGAPLPGFGGVGPDMLRGDPALVAAADGVLRGAPGAVVPPHPHASGTYADPCVLALICLIAWRVPFCLLNMEARQPCAAGFPLVSVTAGCLQHLVLVSLAACLASCAVPFGLGPPLAPTGAAT